MNSSQTCAQLLRGDTAQSLSFLLVRLATLERLDTVDALHLGLTELRETVRLELAHILELADSLDPCFVNVQLRDLKSSLSPVIAHMRAEFGGRVSQETIELSVSGAAEHFRDSRIPTFVPLFVERETRRRLRALTQGEGH